MKKPSVKDIVRRCSVLELPAVLETAEAGITLVRLDHAKSQVPDIVARWAAAKGEAVWVDCHFRDRTRAQEDLWVIQTHEPSQILEAAEGAFTAGMKRFVVWPVSSVLSAGKPGQLRPIGEKAVLLQRLSQLARKHKAVVICGVYLRTPMTLEGTRPAKLPPGIQTVEVAGPAEPLGKPVLALERDDWRLIARGLDTIDTHWAKAGSPQHPDAQRARQLSVQIMGELLV